VELREAEAEVAAAEVPVNRPEDHTETLRKTVDLPPKHTAETPRNPSTMKVLPTTSRSKQSIHFKLKIFRK
jgi:hypothetical protein